MKVKIVPTNVEIEIDTDLSLLQLCHNNSVHIYSLCKGQPKCAECRVKIVEGDQNILPPTSAELAVLGSNYYLDGRRLACQVRAFGNITVDITEQMERDQNAHKKVRGHRPAQKQYQSHAVLDTLMLQQKPDEGRENPKPLGRGPKK